MAEYPALPLWTDAYLADTTHLSDAEHGRYLLLIFHLWRCPKRRFPNDDAWLARKLGRTTDQIRHDFRPIIKEFFKTNGKAIWHGRLEREWSALKARRQSASSRAKRRWNKDNGRCVPAYPPARVPQPHHLDSESYPNSESESLTSEPGGGVGEDVSAPSRSMPSPQAAPAGPPSRSRKAKPEPNGHDPPKRTHGTRLDPAWRPGEDGIAYAMTELGNDAGLVNETWNYFRDYWLAKAGAAARKANWHLTWKTWVRKTRDELRERHAREQRWKARRA